MLGAPVLFKKKEKNVQAQHSETVRVLRIRRGGQHERYARPSRCKEKSAYDRPRSVDLGELLFLSQAEDGIRDSEVTGVQTCALPIYHAAHVRAGRQAHRLLVGVGDENL